MCGCQICHFLVTAQYLILSYLFAWGFLFPLSPAEMLVTPNIVLKSPSDSFLTLQDTSTKFKIVNTTTQQLGPGVQVRL